MDVYISINGPLRNLIQKFDYHYNNEFIESDIVEEVEENDPFEYKALSGVQNDNLLNYYTFQSVDEYNNFLFYDYPLEIFGNAGITYMSAMSDLNKLIYENPDKTLRFDVWDSGINQTLRINPDLVILSIGLEPRADSEAIRK